MPNIDRFYINNFFDENVECGILDANNFHFNVQW